MKHEAWQCWDTRYAVGDGVDYWSDVVVRGVIDAQLNLPYRVEFKGRLSSRTITSSRFVSFESAPHRIVRTPTQARRGDGYIMVGLQLSGGAQLEQQDAKLCLLPGDIAVIDSSRPFNLNFPEPVSRRVVLLSREDAQSVIGAGLLGNTPFVLRRDSGSARLVREAIVMLTQEGSDWTDSDCASMIQALATLLRSPTTVAGSLPCVNRILTQMCGKFADPDLSPATVAKAVGVSTRTFYRILSKEQMTFTAILLQLRLQHAKALIEADNEHSMTHIALDCGFSDAAHFSRAYRARFGEPPSRTRTRVRSLSKRDG